MYINNIAIRWRFYWGNFPPIPIYWNKIIENNFPQIPKDWNKTNKK